MYTLLKVFISAVFQLMFRQCGMHNCYSEYTAFCVHKTKARSKLQHRGKLDTTRKRDEWLNKGKVEVNPGDY